MIAATVCTYFLFSGSKLKSARIMVVLLVVFQPDVISDGRVTKHHDQHRSKIMEDHDDDAVGVAPPIITLPCLKALAARVRVILNPGIEQGRNWNGQR